MALFRRKADPDAPRLGIYIHIPFCVRKCDYCDFYSVPGRDGRMDEYLHALEVHIAESAPQAEIYTVDTIADNLLENQMETAKCRDAVVQSLMRLLKKKLVLVL